MKGCKECYFEIVCKEDKNEICHLFTYECECGEQAELKKDGTKYCLSCALKVAGVEEVPFIQYFLDGEYIGNENDNTEKIIQMCDDDFEIIE